MSRHPLHTLMDRLRQELEDSGHTTPEVEVASIAYRWIAKHCGPVRSKPNGTTMDGLAKKYSRGKK